MKKCLIIMMLFSVGLAGIASAERGKMNYYRWDVNLNNGLVQAYQRTFATVPSARSTVDRNYEFPISNTRSTNALETPTWANGDYYGGRFDGWIIPSETANYLFRITSDDSGQLYLSPDEKPIDFSVTQTPISRVGTDAASASAGQRDWFDADVVQSASIPLTAGKAYYFVAVWKDGSGGDGCSVGWMNDKSIPAFTPIPLKNVSNTYPVGINLDATYPDSAAVEFELWQKPEWSADSAAAWVAVVNPDGKGLRLPDFSTLGAPTRTGLLSGFGLGDRMGSTGGNPMRFLYRQYAIIKLDAPDTLTFGVTSDDGSKLYIGNWWEASPSLTLLVNNDINHGGRWFFNSIALPAGYVGIVVEMFQQSGGIGLSAGFSSATVPWHTIASGEVYSARDASRPSPVNFANVPVDTALTWSKPVANEGATNILYFAEAGQPLTEVYRGANSTWTPTLAPDKGYQWRVDVEEPNAAHPSTPDILTGQLWGFTTRTPAEKKLVAYWPLDSDLADASGNLKPGQYFSPTLDAEAPVFETGVKGNALAINIADTTKSQYAKLADIDVAALSTTGIRDNAPRTMACWVKNAVPMPTGTNPSDWCTIFGFTSIQGATSNNYLTARSFDFDKRGGQDQYCIHRNGAENNMQIIDDNWHYLVATFEPGSVYLGTLKWYVDGNYRGTATNVRLWTQDIVHIGKRAHSNPLWRGWVDEARIYNYAMTPEETLQLYLNDALGASFCLGTTYPAYDFDKNCVVDTGDMILFAADWLKENMVP